MSDLSKAADEIRKRIAHREAGGVNTPIDLRVMLDREEELKSLHTTYRLDLSDHIETCLRKLADHFPGFRFSTDTGERGWGAEISRDDLSVGGSRYSRLEMVISPYSPVRILELKVKGTIRNKEFLVRNRYQLLAEADADSFVEMIDLWVLEFAEAFAESG